ncbi:MAG: class I SAM-dependent methyltransferase [Acidobacteria bacterium]|nr:class I SAM-dependent methyltransferase [Acidobacteriota bacterium]
MPGRVRLSVPALVFCGVLAAAAAQNNSPDVPFVPTSPEVVEQMLKLAQVKPSDTVYDLGCGDGRIVIMAAEKFGATATGVDIDPERIREATENARHAGVTKKVHFVHKNLFDADIHDATVVTLYLLPSVNMKLRPKLLRDLKPGTRIVSNSFDMGDWKPDKELDYNGRRLYLWIVPSGSIRTQ